MRIKNLLLKFNRGIVSALALARVDVERIAVSAEIMTNWMCRVLGPMSLRPGMKYLGEWDNKAKFIPFQFSYTEKSEIEATDLNMRVWKDDAVVTRESVSTTITNGDFALTPIGNGWTDESDTTGVIGYDATNEYMELSSGGTDQGIAENLITVVDVGTAHGIRIKIAFGPVEFRIGSTSGDDDIVALTKLEKGEHSIVAIPTGDMYLQLAASSVYTSLIESVEIEASGDMEIPTPWVESDQPLLRWAQSADIVYVAADGVRQQQIERRDNDSWSVVEYPHSDGPFRTENVSAVTIAASALTGDITLTASKGIFKEGHADALFRLESAGQEISTDLTNTNDETTPYLRVSGIESGRKFTITLNSSDYGTASVRLQYSVGAPGNWVNYTTTGPWTTNQSNTQIDDNQDNVIMYYRLMIESGTAVSAITATLSYPSGSILGVARVTAFNSATELAAKVLSPMGGTDPTTIWWEGLWSEFRGYPSAVTIYEGRLWWAGRDKIVGSVSDAYNSFDSENTNDSGPINRTIGAGPVRQIHWLQSMGRLLMGTARNSANIQAVEITGNNVLSGRSSSFDEPLTPTNFNLKTTSPRCVFVDRSGQKLYEMAYNTEISSYEGYGSDDLSLLAPDLNRVGLVMVAAQEKPDLRLHCLRADGKVAVLVFDRAENVKAWVLVEMTGFIEDIVIQPGAEEDIVRYVVLRNNKRYLLRWALESECEGGDLNKQADYFVEYSGLSTDVITGLDHLEGDTVVAWGSGKDLGTYVVSGGQITLSEAVTSCIVGLSYDATFKSMKLSNMQNSPLNEKKKIDHIGLTVLNTHNAGLQYGQSLDRMSDMPRIVQGREVGVDEVYVQLEDDHLAFDGTWDMDSRLYLTASAPRPATVLGCSLRMDVTEK